MILRDKTSISKLTDDNISVCSLREAMHIYAKNHVGYFCRSIAKGINNITSSGSSNLVTFRKKRKIMERMEDNLRKYKKNKDPQAEAELSVIFKSIDIDTLIVICSKLPKKQMEMLCNTANPYKLAEQSRIKLIVEKSSSDNIKGTDGYYLLYLEKDDKKLQVHFKRKESFVIYLIYLLDKYKNDSVDTMVIINEEELFVKLFEMNYDDADGKESFKKMKPRLDAKGSIQQGQLKHCYSDIRESISNVCTQLDELPLPFILMSPQDHLEVLKSNIFISQDILNQV